MNAPLFLRVACLAAAAFVTHASAERSEIIIPATALAKPDQQADTPAPGKWWLNRNAQAWGARDGIILMAGPPSDEVPRSGLWEVTPMTRFVPYRVPDLVIDPNATGWYRIHIGLYRDDLDMMGSPPHLQGKLSDEPFPEYLQAPQGGKERTAETYWKAADLTGRKIHIIQPPAPRPHAGAGWMGGVTHLRLVPMTEQEVADAKQELELPPVNQRLFAMLDTTDEIFWNGTAETKEDIHAMIWRHQQAGFGRIFWRSFGTCLDNSPAVPAAAPRWTEKEEQAFTTKNHCKVGWMSYFDLARRFDPLKVAVEYGNEIGSEVHAMVRFTNFNRPPFANFWHDHPEYLAQVLVTEKDPKTGARVPVKPYKLTPYSRVLSFAYPEVRTFYVSFMKQIASTGTKGILIDLLRHPPIAGYEPIVSEAFKKKYGKDMESFDLYNDPLVQEHFSDYLRLFLVELRAAIGNDIEISVRCSGPDNFGLRGSEFIEAGLVNTIIDGHWYSGNAPRPTMDATVAAVGTRGRAMAAAEISIDVDPANQWKATKALLSPTSITALANAYSGRGVTSFGLYESTMHVWRPDARRAIRAAGWSYDPGKKK
ncbi:hypothetical protein [Prosthecobacter sp.]|uniref:hypothetical protein n=1 Tax=Prosthecobacter sp. TaxID=1965333 RepID=UPI003784C622